MGKFVDRTGETNIANCGMQMTIIDYQGYSNATVMFEDGAIKEHVRYSTFRDGTLTHPNQLKKQTKVDDRTGETVVAGCGMKMTIVKYINSGDITVKFEDGTIVQHKQYTHFKNGKIQNPNAPSVAVKDRVGETSVSTYGLKMTILNYYDCEHMDVIFEDGYIAKNVQYYMFVKGYVRHPSYRSTMSATKIGQTKPSAICGLNMTITQYCNRNDVTVTFEDGSYQKHVTHQMFSKGHVKHPTFDARSNTNNLKLHGFVITGLAYKKSDNIGHYFCTCETCKIKDVMSTAEMAAHALEHKNNPKQNKHASERENLTNISNCGLKMTIAKYRGSHDIDVLFEDGYIASHVRYDNFLNGHVRHPSTKKGRRPMFAIGTTKTAQSGLRMTLTEYHGSRDITVTFEDGCVVKHNRYDRFRKGLIKHPKFDTRRRTNSLPMHGFIITGLAYKDPNGDGNYFCTCQKCKTNDIMSTAEMERHARQHDEGVI